MSYVSRTLGAKEQIVFLTGYHWLYWLWGLLLISPALAVALATLPYAAADFLFLSLAVIPAIFGVVILVRAMTLEVAVTTDRFVKKTGLIEIKTEEVSLDKVEEVNVHQSVMGRIFGYGIVNVHGTGAGAIHVSFINDPVLLRREIQAAREGVKIKSE